MEKKKRRRLSGNADYSVSKSKHDESKSNGGTTKLEKELKFEPTFDQKKRGSTQMSERRRGKGIPSDYRMKDKKKESKGRGPKGKGEQQFRKTSWGP